MRNPEERLVCDFDLLVDKSYMDEGSLKKTTRVVIRRGLSVGFCAVVTAGKLKIKDNKT